MEVHNRTLKMFLEEIKIEKYRKRLTYQDLSKVTELPEQTLVKKLNGRSPINIQQLLSLCSALGVSAPALIARAEARLTEENTEGVV